METIVGKKTILSEPKIVLSAILLSLTITTASAAYITSNSPRSYTSTAKLQVVRLADFGQAIAGSGGTVSFVELVKDPYFKRLVLREAGKSNKKNQANQLSKKFEVNARSIENTNLLEISVEAAKPKDAKLLADAAAQALVKKSVELKTPSFENMQSIIAVALESIDKDLVELRSELFQLQDGTNAKLSPDDKTKMANLEDQIAAKASLRAEKVDSASPAELEQIDKELTSLRSELFQLQDGTNAKLSPEDKTKMTNLEDQINVKESLRRSFTDYLNKAAFNDLFNKEVLKIVYLAEIPRRPSSPPWRKNMAVATIAGLLVGIAALSVADMFYKARYYIRGEWDASTRSYPA